MVIASLRCKIVVDLGFDGRSFTSGKGCSSHPQAVTSRIPTQLFDLALVLRAPDCAGPSREAPAMRYSKYGASVVHSKIRGSF